MSNKIRVDRIDRDILLQLRRDGRLTNVELAKRVGLTPPPCLRRVKRLQDGGVITGYRAVINPAAVGRGLEVSSTWTLTPMIWRPCKSSRPPRPATTR
jgi:DNA-binding Lrp family transcriptional regulator